MAHQASNDNPIPFSSQARLPPLNITGKGTGVDQHTSTYRLRSENKAMSDVTREEMDAKLQATEARLETRLVSMDAKLDNLLNEVRRVGDIARDAKDAASEAKAAASSIKWNVLFAALGGIGISASLVIAFWAIGWQIADIMRSQ